MAWKTGRVQLRDGPALSYLEHGEPQGIAVMLIHSYASTGREFEPLFPYLPSWIHAYAFTFHGHGEAGGEGMGYTVRDLSDEIVAFMDAANVQSAVMVGASSGGYIAQWFAGEHPARVRGLVTIGSPRSFQDKPAFSRMRDTVLALADPVDPEFARQFGGDASLTHLPDGYIEEMVAESCRIRASVWKETYLGLWESPVPSTTFRISAPTLLIWGDRDHFLPRGDQEALRDAVPGSRLLVYEGVGHLVLWEAPEKVAGDLVQFVQQLHPES